jgi:hypothetical protein
MIKSIQTGLATLTNNITGDYGTSRGTDITISSVDTNKSMVYFGHDFACRVDGVLLGNSSGKLTSSTNLQISVPYTGYTYVPIRWQIIEFY